VDIWTQLWLEDGPSAINRNITIDRSPPSLITATFSAPLPSEPNTVEIHAEAFDELAGVDHIAVFYRSGSPRAELVNIGAIAGSSGTVEWETSELPTGVYQVLFDVKDRAGNWGLWTDGTQSEFTYSISRHTEIYLPLVMRGSIWD